MISLVILPLIVTTAFALPQSYGVPSRGLGGGGNIGLSGSTIGLGGGNIGLSGGLGGGGNIGLSGGLALGGLGGGAALGGLGGGVALGGLGGGASLGGLGGVSSQKGSFGGAVALGPCGGGLVRKADGSCVKPIVSRNIFLYNAPRPKVSFGPPPQIPDPKIHYNFVFVRAQDTIVGPKPVVVPPPQQKTLVYVLSKRPEAIGQQLIEVPGQLEEPEVFFVNYNEGENPVLPGGIDLQTALSQSAGAGRIIDASGGGIGGVSSGIGGLGGGLVSDFDDSDELLGGGFGGGFSGSVVGGADFSSGGLKGSYSSHSNTILSLDQNPEGSSVVVTTLKRAVEEPNKNNQENDE